MNYGKLFGWTMVVLSFLASIGYLAAKNYRLALYWFFAGCIAITVTY